MARLRRGGQTALVDAEALRFRAAWLYHHQGLTQNAVAERLGISRTSVIKLLDEALRRGEVQIRVDSPAGHRTELALRLERALGLDEAIVTPRGDGFAATTRSVGLALGQFLSDAVPDGATVGVGWGRTLTASLGSFRPPRRTRVRAVSLLGGTIDAGTANPIDFTWQFASRLGAECYLFMAPLLVDSPDTKRRLIERCGLDAIFELARSLDIALVSVGDIGAGATSLSRSFLTETELEELVALGCVCDTLCRFLDIEGRTVPHTLDGRVMAVELDTVRAARHVVIASGGAHRAIPVIAAIKRLGCNTLVTDEDAAARILDVLETGSGGLTRLKGATPTVSGPRPRADRRRRRTARSARTGCAARPPASAGWSAWWS